MSIGVVFMFSHTGKVLSNIRTRPESPSYLDVPSKSDWQSDPRFAKVSNKNTYTANWQCRYLLDVLSEEVEKSKGNFRVLVTSAPGYFRYTPARSCQRDDK